MGSYIVVHGNARVGQAGGHGKVTKSGQIRQSWSELTVISCAGIDG
jgi:hypothetical protein